MNTYQNHMKNYRNSIKLESNFNLNILSVLFEGYRNACQNRDENG